MRLKKTENTKRTNFLQKSNKICGLNVSANIFSVVLTEKTRSFFQATGGAMAASLGSGKAVLNALASEAKEKQKEKNIAKGYNDRITAALSEADPQIRIRKMAHAIASASPAEWTAMMEQLTPAGQTLAKSIMPVAQTFVRG